MSEQTAETGEKGQANSVPRCQSTCRDGSRCKAAVLPGQTTCLFHSPEHEALRVDARRRGGLSRAAMLLPVELGFELDWATPAGLLRIIGAAAEKMLLGRLDPSRARALGAMASTVLAALRDEIMEARIAELERLVSELEREDGAI